MSEQQFPFFGEDSEAANYCKELVMDLAEIDVLTFKGMPFDKLFDKSIEEMEELHTQCAKKFELLEKKYPRLTAIWHLANFQLTLRKWIQTMKEDEIARQEAM